MLRHLPNLICLVRIALVWPTVDALQSGKYWTALILVVGVLGALPGFAGLGVRDLRRAR